ncbi:hypothetical protein PanWU01x14_270800 [Parasponia andersonii]|uniref:Transmembrane protein n=1 Tax=Parasponia andersonii TaxID=3476 RepID=A0A2P5B504_PARAD|nr:hypothetical protein PanWU01x14_270800 [Parasponia andersonii]
MSTATHQAQTGDDDHNGADSTLSNSSTSSKSSTEKEVEELKEINKKQEKRISNLESKALQDMNRYFVVQGVILSSISASTFKCQNWWIPFVLSLLTGFLNSVNLYRNTDEFLKCSEELDQNMADLNSKKRIIKSTNIQGMPNNGQATTGISQDQKADSHVQRKRWLFSYLNFIVCTATTIFICVSCYLIKC